ncbi:MAG: hypothetical protein CMP08_05520 [Xanthomonadales bacterium]|nr:hypothetical protein [Xanthomonadales bacterium]
MIKHLVIDQARRWLSDPHNRDRLKKAGRSAWQAYQDSRRQREPGHGPGDAPRGRRDQSAAPAGRSRSDDQTG